MNFKFLFLIIKGWENCYYSLIQNFYQNSKEYFFFNFTFLIVSPLYLIYLYLFILSLNYFQYLFFIYQLILLMIKLSHNFIIALINHYNQIFTKNLILPLYFKVQINYYYQKKAYLRFNFLNQHYFVLIFQVHLFSFIHNLKLQLIFKFLFYFIFKLIFTQPLYRNYFQF